MREFGPYTLSGIYPSAEFRALKRLEGALRVVAWSLSMGPLKVTPYIYISFIYPMQINGANYDATSVVCSFQVCLLKNLPQAFRERHAFHGTRRDLLRNLAYLFSKLTFNQRLKERSSSG